jgi:prephenate dehydrogenase
VARTLNIIGAGHLGRVLGRLFAASGAFEVQDVLTRSAGSAADAVNFIGAGRAAGAMADLRRADAVMLAVSDDQIEPVCGALAAAGAPTPAPWRATSPAPCAESRATRARWR